jgi:hypothetical protein
MTLPEIQRYLYNVEATGEKVEASLNRLVAYSDYVYCVTTRLDENEIEGRLEEKHQMVF